MLQIQSFIFSPIQENTYILYNESRQCIIIDPGSYFDEEKEAMKNFIAQKQLVPAMLLNTHSHLDHVFGNKFILLSLTPNATTKPIIKFNYNRSAKQLPSILINIVIVLLFCVFSIIISFYVLVCKAYGI